jgi:hypothetical protein
MSAPSEITVTVDIGEHTFTGTFRVKNGRIRGRVLDLEYDAPDSYMKKNEEKIENELRESANGTLAAMLEEEADRGFEVYDDEEAYGSEEMIGMDDVWG